MFVCSIVLFYKFYKLKELLFNPICLLKYMLISTLDSIDPDIINSIFQDFLKNESGAYNYKKSKLRFLYPILGCNQGRIIKQNLYNKKIIQVDDVINIENNVDNLEKYKKKVLKFDRYKIFDCFKKTNRLNVSILDLAYLLHLIYSKIPEEEIYNKMKHKIVCNDKNDFYVKIKKKLYDHITSINGIEEMKYIDFYKKYDISDFIIILNDSVFKINEDKSIYINSHNGKNLDNLNLTIINNKRDTLFGITNIKENIFNMYFKENINKDINFYNGNVLVKNKFMYHQIDGNYLFDNLGIGIDITNGSDYDYCLKYLEKGEFKNIKINVLNKLEKIISIKEGKVGNYWIG